MTGSRDVVRGVFSIGRLLFLRNGRELEPARSRLALRLHDQQAGRKCDECYSRCCDGESWHQDAASPERPHRRLPFRVDLVEKKFRHDVRLTRSTGEQAEFGAYLDQLSLIMLGVVTGVGFLIHVYSVGYMEHEGGYYRFFAYLNLFMFFMLTLVLGNNYLLMFVGWEGVGLASYLLIGCFFRKDSAAQAGKKAFITNRVGDFGFLIGLFLIIQHWGSLKYNTVFDAVSQFGVETHAGLFTAIGICLLIGACGKSAQIPLYVWLPDAMEGPTPVSALIHAATMVTAGVYLVGRMHPIYDVATYAHGAVAIIGAVTALFAATVALVQTDIKRVLAYSTMSQIGYMFLAVGIGAYSAGMFHLLSHAFFKALLFLAAGNVIHAMHDEQDMRRYGGLWGQMRPTSITFLIGSLSLVGVIPLVGFFSMEQILGAAFSKPADTLAPILWVVGAATALLTGFYTGRMWWLAFWGKPSAQRPVEHPHEAPLVMMIPVAILAVLAPLAEERADAILVPAALFDYLFASLAFQMAPLLDEDRSDVELLGHVLHPELVPENPSTAAQALTVEL